MNLSITNECNRCCPFCFQKSWYLAKSKENVKEMSLQNIEKILNWCIEDKIKLLGGEPLLHSQFLQIVKLFEKYNKTFGLLTNLNIENALFKSIFSTRFTNYRGMLINTDYHKNQQGDFFNNLDFLLRTGYPFKLGTTLLPSEAGLKLSITRLLNVLSCLDSNKEYSIRISPMTPNHDKETKLFNFSNIIFEFIDTLSSKNKKLQFCFDCPLTACEFDPDVLDAFRKNKSISFITGSCYEHPPFDVLVDNSAIWCGSSNHIKINNIFDYANSKEVLKALKDKYIEYWRKTQINCDYKNCNKFNPAYCMGTCIGKNDLYTKSVSFNLV